MQISLKCPNCGESGRCKTIDSRSRLNVNYIHRRKQCSFCNTKFTTIEMTFAEHNKIVELDELVLVKKSKIDDMLNILSTIK